MPLDKNAACLAHFTPYRFDIGIAGGVILMQHVQAVRRSWINRSGSLVKPTISGRFAASNSDGNGTPGTNGTLAALMLRFAR